MKTGVRNIIRHGAAPLALGIGLCSGLAHAQEAPGAAADDSIIVTGTRIRLPNLTNPEPTVTISADYLQDRGLTNVADAINESPGVRGSTTPQGLQTVFGQGMNFTNLYGLGVNRTLVLVNGKRQVSSLVPSLSGTPGTPVDLNTIPTILVDRIDRVGIGGAPVYGTDAIAGTVNLILKRRFTGLDLSATSGITEEGDNFRINLSAVGGFDFAEGRGNITGAISYDRSDGVLYNDRWFYRAGVVATANPTSALAAALGPSGRTAATDGRLNPNIGFNDSTTDGYPGTVLILNQTRPTLSTNGVLSAGNKAFALQFDSGSNLVAFNTGTLFGSALSAASTGVAGFTANSAVRASGGDGFKLNDYNQIVSGVKRLNTALFATYDLGDHLRLSLDGTWSHSTGDQLVTQPSYNSAINTGRSGALQFLVTNPFLSAQAKQALANAGYTTNFTMSRVNTDLTDPSGKTTSDVYRGVASLEGDFSFGGRSFNFEAYLDYGRTDVVDYYQDLDQQKFINAINVASVNGQIVCTTAQTATVISITSATLVTPVADSACQPLNLFGSGAASQAALAYIRHDTVNRSRLEQFVANINVGGSPFDLNSNPVSFNAGFEHHAETGSFTPDTFIQQGLGRLAAVQPLSGTYQLDEEFGEVLVPLVTPANNWLISKLEAFARVRQVNSSSAKGDFTAWSVGGAFAPVSDIEFRGNVTRSFRAPSIVELYSPRTVSTAVSVYEPCAAANINAGSSPAVRAANCAAFIAKYGQPAAGTVTVAGYTGGNPNLHNERADSFTYGVILRPRMVPGLSIAVDYVNIKVKDPITFLGAGSAATSGIAQSCFDNPTFNTADPANGNVYCSLIQRTSTGAILNDPGNPGVTIGYVNGQRITMDAVQATVDYVTGLDRIGLNGSLGLGADMFFLRNRLVDITGVAPTQSEGLVGDPKFQGQLRLRYAAPAWGLSTNVNVTGAQALAYTQRGPSPNDTREIDHYDPYATVDASIWLSTADRFRLTFSVTNLFNRIGQSYFGYYIPGANSTAGSINDALGRRFTISARKRY
ncbi:TonB-dependent receptor domain-containing protein [Novosphingobium flavum]|uniref:TonB-dependent receptor domain-containing protein n=1 Tax=Novosphingobium flavum TaxID=1778672 RepID=UPI0031B5ACD3